MKTKRFKGGPIALNSGGMGPDNYLIKPVKGGWWTLVIFRWGRNWTGDNEIAERDREAMKEMFPLEQVCVPDNAKQYWGMKQKGNVPSMGASDFLDKYREVG